MVDGEVEIVQQWIEWDQGLVWQDKKGLITIIR